MHASLNYIYIQLAIWIIPGYYQYLAIASYAF